MLIARTETIALAIQAQLNHEKPPPGYMKNYSPTAFNTVEWHNQRQAIIRQLRQLMEKSKHDRN